MNTEILSSNEIARASEILKNGGLVAMPTETVYGLAANAFNKDAVVNIFKAKGRPVDNPLIVHVESIEQAKSLVLDFNENAKKLAEAFWPGPLTIILKNRGNLPQEVTAGLDTVAIRFPSHPVARALIKESKLPLAAPSANLSGSPSPTTAKHVLNDLCGKIDAVLDGGPCECGLESTVITLAEETPRLLRPGSITLEDLKTILPDIYVDPAVLNKLEEGKKVISPGLKYKHYAPKANVIILNGTKEQFIDYVNEKASKKIAALCYNDDEKFLKVKCFTYGNEKDYKDQANKLFDALRKIDDSEVKTVYARCPKLEGVGMAVYNRLIRAAGFEVITLG